MQDQKRQRRTRAERTSLLLSGPPKLQESSERTPITEVKEEKEDESEPPTSKYKKKKNLSITIDDKDNATKADPVKASSSRVMTRKSELKQPLEALEVSKVNSKKSIQKAQIKKYDPKDEHITPPKKTMSRAFASGSEQHEKRSFVEQQKKGKLKNMTTLEYFVHRKSQITPDKTAKAKANSGTKEGS